MRSAAEMMDIIIRIAQSDRRIRAVEMNGSRANPAAPIDCFQDYDICYYVTEVASFTADHAWIDIFGGRIMLQMPELNRNPVGDGHFTYLMLFTDGNRLDLSLVPVGHYDKDNMESQSILLLDKDGFMPVFPPASDKDYHIQPPSQLDYDSACNDFWWCSQNVAKGIWRDELPYVMYMYDHVLREEFHDMIEWYIGAKTGYTVSAGKSGKYFKNYLDARQYGLYSSTYTGSDYPSIWNALFTMCSLFREFAKEVADACGFAYPETDDRNMTAYLKHVKNLPREAREIQ